MKTIFEVIEIESKELEKEAATSSYAHFLSGRRWEKIHLALGLPTTALAAIAGVTAFTEVWDLGAGLIAMFVAGLSALSTFLNPGDRANLHRQAYAEFNELKREISMLRDIDARLANKEDEETVRKFTEQLRNLMTRITQIEKNAPAINLSSKQKAEAKINSKAASEDKQLAA
jgi:hypothetical protein